MLAIRMQRTGRKKHAMFRVVVQDSRLTPTSGRVVATIGSYDPHAKTTTLVKEKAEFYLGHGAQPSERVVRLFEREGVALPTWVKTSSTIKQRAIRHPEKLRRNQAKDTAADTVEETTVAEAPAAEASDSTESTETKA